MVQRSHQEHSEETEKEKLERLILAGKGGQSLVNIMRYENQAHLASRLTDLWPEAEINGVGLTSPQHVREWLCRKSMSDAARIVVSAW